MSAREAAQTALRKLQQYDEVAHRPAGALMWRPLLIEAQDALAEILGLECTGEREGAGHYDHSGDTCPVHEWLDPEDQREITRRAGILE